MIFKPWDCAQPDEWLPQSLRLCWGDGSGDGSGFGDSSGSSGWGDTGSGFGDTGATTGPGDWGSAGSYDASGFNAATADFYASALADSPAGFYDTGGPGIAPGALGAEFGGTFGPGEMSGQPGTNAFGAELDAGGGNTSGIGNALASWGQSTLAGGPGAGTNAAYDLSGGMFGDYGGSGYGGSGYGGSSFGGFGTGTGTGGSTYGGSGGRGSVTDSTPGYVGSASGGKDVTGSEVSSPYADDTGPTGRGEQDTVSGAAAPTSETSDFGSPTSETSEEAGPAETSQEAGPSITGPVGGREATQDEAPTSSNFGPQALAEGLQTLSDLTQSALAPQQDTFDSRFGFDTSAPPQDSFDSRFGFDTSAPTPGIDAYISGGRGTDFDYGPGPQTAAPNFDQVFADLGIQPGWNPAEQLAGRTGLAEPTDWAANPYEASTDVSVGRDFDQAFAPFGDTPTGMDLAADQKSETEPSLTFNEMWGDTPYNTLPNDPLSRSAQETLTHDFGYFPNPGYVQGPQEQTLSDRANAIMNAIIDPVANVTMYPFARGLDYLMGIPDNALSPPSEPGLGGPDMATSPSGATSTIPGGRETNFEYSPSTTAPAPDWGSVFEGAAPTEAQPSVEAFIPGGRETNFEYNVAAPQAPIDVEVVRSDDPSVPADPRADPATPPATLPPAVPTDESGRPTTETPESGRPAEQQPLAPPPQTPQTPPQEARPAPPSLVEMVPTPPSQTPPAQPPGLTTMLPPPTLTPPTQPPSVPPSETRPAETPAEPGRPDDHDAPEPPDTSQPPQDPNAPRPPESIPGVLIGSRGTYENERADNPRTNRNYLDSGRLDNPQGEPGITFRSARQAGVEPLFRIGDIDVGNVSARLVENVNRALRDMERTTGIPANSLVATSGQRFAHRGGAIIHGADPRTSQESVRSRGNASGGGGFPAAPPGHSNHGAGRALDFAASRARDWLRAHAGEYGLETLGTRRGVPFDAPHIQLRGGAGANMGARPSEQEQAEQRTINEQNRQAAIDRGLLPAGRGQTQQARPAPPPGGWRGIGGDAARDARLAAPPQPPADLGRLPPQAPQETRPPADIPTLAPRGPNEFDIPVTAPVRNATVIANNILKQATAHLNVNSDTAALNAAGVVAARAMAAAGIPANLARSLMLKGAMDGAIANGYGPGGPRSTVMGFSIWGKVQSTITESIDAAMQGYQPAKPGELRGPPAPAAPGRQGAAPFGQQFADLSQSLGSVAPSGMTGRPGEIGAQQPMFSIPGLDRLSPIIAPPVPPAPALPGIMLAGFSPGGQPADAPAASEEGGPTPPAPPAGLLDPNTVDTRGIPSTLGLPTQPDAFRKAYEAIYGGRWLAKGGHVDKDEPVVVGEEGPETFVPDQPGTVVPHQPQPGKTRKTENIDRWPKIPAPNFPGRYGGVEREILRQTREAQNPVQSLIDLVDSGRLPLNAANWHAMLNDPALIALGRSRMEDNRKGIDPGAEQYGAFIPAPAPAADPPDPSSPMAQALGYGSIKRRPMQIGRQAY